MTCDNQTANPIIVYAMRMDIGHQQILVRNAFAGQQTPPLQRRMHEMYCIFQKSIIKNLRWGEITESQQCVGISANQPTAAWWRGTEMLDCCLCRPISRVGHQNQIIFFNSYCLKIKNILERGKARITARLRSSLFHREQIPSGHVRLFQMSALNTHNLCAVEQGLSEQLSLTIQE